MAQKYDVIVVGSGFGGPVAAKKCADAGLKTVMLERGQVPGEKVFSGLVIPIWGFLFGPEFIRNGNPPIERPIGSIVNRFIKDGEIYDTDRSFSLPKPAALGYAAYCTPFCTWLADRAVEAGAELRTSTTAVELIQEKGRINGVITHTGEKLRAKIVIDAGGTQNPLSIKAGLRKKFALESLELYVGWDFEMPKEHIDRVFGTSVEFFHAMPEERIGAPLGYGSTLYFFTYRNSIHPGMGQFLLTNGKVPNLTKLLKEYFENFKEKVTRWKKDIAPYVKLKAMMWDVAPVYAGLIPEMREMPIHGDGILIIGDAAGLEAAAHADGVPNAWFSADIAADVAIEAIAKGDTSASFLEKYDDRIKSHPFIMHSITDWRRYNLREVLKTKSHLDLRERIVDHWGIGGFRYKYDGKAWIQAMSAEVLRNPAIILSWIEMTQRYYRNWETNSFDQLSVQHPSYQRKENKTDVKRNPWRGRK